MNNKNNIDVLSDPLIKELHESVSGLVLRLRESKEKLQKLRNRDYALKDVKVYEPLATDFFVSYAEERLIVEEEIDRYYNSSRILEGEIGGFLNDFLARRLNRKIQLLKSDFNDVVDWLDNIYSKEYEAFGLYLSANGGDLELLKRKKKKEDEEYARKASEKDDSFAGVDARTLQDVNKAIDAYKQNNS